MGDIDDLVKYLRHQRHDFMNDLQIIYGYLQIGKIEETKKYINDVSKKNGILSILYNLGDNFLAICFEECLVNMWKKDIEVVLDAELDHIDKSIFEIDYDKKCNLVNNIFNEMENNNFKFVYIYLFEDEKGKNLFISNNEELVDELNWMEEWERLDTKISKVEVYKCNYENNIAYRIICSL